MATERFYYLQPKARTLYARILACEPAKNGWEILLDRTIFYPTGGGQPCDLGQIGQAQVLDVRERGDEVVHLADAPLPVGQEVECAIDWTRRLDLTQQHSGEHLVSGIIHARFGFENVGFHMGSDVITIDFSGELTLQALAEVELAANEAVWADIPTKIWYPAPSELKTLPYRSKKELTGAVRLVQFGGIDLCACCGTHVERTGEIGLIKLLSTTRFHSGSRVELLCGGRALRYLNAVFAQNREISGLLSAKSLETAEAVRRLCAESEKMKYRLTQTENALFAERADALRGRGNVLLLQEAMQPDALRRLADAVTQACGGCCMAFAGEDGDYKYAVGQKNGDLRGLVRELNAALNGRGGGKPEFAQGSVKADRAQIEAFYGSYFGKENLQ